MCENPRESWWLYSMGEEQQGMQKELEDGSGKAQLKLPLWRLSYFSNNAIKYITEVCD